MRNFKIRHCVMVFLAIASIVMTGCAGKQMTRAEQLALRDKSREAAVNTYQGFTKDQVIEAAEKTLRLIDPTDAVFTHTEDKMVMTRPYSLFLGVSSVHGYDFWIMEFKEKENQTIETTVTVVTIQNSGPFAQMPKIPPLGGVGVSQSTLSEAEAKAFYKRLDYMLGIEKQWMTRADALKMAEENGYVTNIGAYGGHFNFLCGDNWYGIADKSPNS